MHESILIGILIFGILQAIFFAFLFLSKKEKALSDKILIVWLLVLAMHIGLIVVNVQGHTIHFLRYLPILVALLYGPLLHFYVSTLTSRKPQFAIINLVHFSPFVLLLLISLLFPNNSKLLTQILSGVSCVSGVLYCFTTFFLLRNHIINLEYSFSNIENIDLAWVRKLVLGLLIIWPIVLILVVLYRFFNIALPLNWIFTTIPFFIFYLGYYGIKQRVIYSSVRVSRNNKSQNRVRAPNSYKKSGLQPNAMKAIHAKLIGCMQVDKLYLNPTLSLTDLSNKCSIPEHHITQTLNDFAHINFCDFVNGYRIEAFRGKIAMGLADQFSLLGIAFDCGFNSKSSFNRIFKRFTGQSPSEYKNSLP